METIGALIVIFFNIMMILGVILSMVVTNLIVAFIVKHL